MDHIVVTSAKYIKLGLKGRWEGLCLGDGTIRLGYDAVPHDLAVSGNISGLRDYFVAEGFAPGIATTHTN